MPGAIDLDSLVAIDVHVHAGRSSTAPPNEAGPTRDDTLARMTQRMGAGSQTPDETADFYLARAASSSTLRLAATMPTTSACTSCTK